MATRMAQYSLSPFARSVQTSTYCGSVFNDPRKRRTRCSLTIAIHRAIPTKINPSLSPRSSGRNAHANASCYRIMNQLFFFFSHPLNSLQTPSIHTMKKGATIQLTTILNPICTHSDFSRNDRCNNSYRTLHKIGYIMINSPTAFAFLSARPLPCLPSLQSI